jgi:hypothetical protein
VVHSIEKLFDVEIDHDVVAARNVALRLRHRLMRRAPRPEAEAVLGERPIPVRLQHLHDRLLEEAVEHRRDVGCIMHLVQFGFGDGEARRGDLATQSRRL